MPEMRYEAPKTLEQAVALLAATKGARILAGGTDLILQMRAGRRQPSLLVDVKNIPEMTRIEVDGAKFRIGAAVPCTDVAAHKTLAAEWPGLIDAVNVIGSLQVRARATIGGNLCNASPAADSVPALIACGARATIIGPAGRREALVETISSGPGTTSLAPGEIVSSFILPRGRTHLSSAYLRFTPRTEMDIAVVGAGVALELDAQGHCKNARIAIGAVAPRALLVPEAATAIVGTPINEGALGRLAQACRAASQPIDDKRGSREFRLQVVGVMARRACEMALARARRKN